MTASEKQPLDPTHVMSKTKEACQRKTCLGLSARKWLIGVSAVTVVSAGAIGAIALVLLTRRDDMCIIPGVSDSIFTKDTCPDGTTDCGDYSNHKACEAWCKVFAQAASKAVQTYCSHLPSPSSPLPPG